MHGHEEVVKLLLETGEVDVGLKDDDSRTPSFWAVVLLLLGTGICELKGRRWPNPVILCHGKWR